MRYLDEDGWGLPTRSFNKKNLAFEILDFATDFDNEIRKKELGVFSYATFAYSGYRRITNTPISGIKELEEHPFEGATQFNAQTDPSKIFQWITNTIAGEAIDKSQNNIKEAQEQRQSIQQLEEAIGMIIDRKIEFKLETKPYAVKIEVDHERLDFNLLPDGLKSIVSWLSDLLMRLERVKWVDNIPVLQRNFILFLDEIEVHLHPAWQRKILPAVQKLFPNAQIFISTHSPFVVGSIDGAWIHKLEKVDGASRLAKGYPMLSEDAKSYRYWLEEVFDIKSEYGQAAVVELDEFYRLRTALLAGSNGSTQASFVQTGKALAQQSDELRNIIEMEFRQINRRLSLNLSL
jgi:predicted ATP-binding protein involved in virulence